MTTKLEEAVARARLAVDMIEDMYSMELAERESWGDIREALGLTRYTEYTKELMEEEIAIAAYEKAKEMEE